MNDGYVVGSDVRKWTVTERSHTLVGAACPSDTIVTIHHDGRIEINPKYTVDEAAKAFWDAVKTVAAKESM